MEMLGFLHTRRRNRYGIHLCAIAAMLLLLFSVLLLHSRLSTKRRGISRDDRLSNFDDPLTLEGPLLRDSDPDLRSTLFDDRIDELDIVEDDSKISNEGENEDSKVVSTSSSGYYFDHVSQAIRLGFGGKSIDEFDQWEARASEFDFGRVFNDKLSRVAFGSDDLPVDEEVRRKVVKVKGIEDALLLKLDSHGSPLREGWAPWFDAKSVFLRKDRMFRSSLEMLNPLNNMHLQDPDGSGVTGLTRGDKLFHKELLENLKKKKPLVGDK